MLDLLTHLVDKSLVAIDAEGARYRLLETVRQYARGKLDGAGEGDDTRGAAPRVLRHVRRDGARVAHRSGSCACAREARPRTRERVRSATHGARTRAMPMPG